jgi:hypothetical protein
MREKFCLFCASKICIINQFIEIRLVIQKGGGTGPEKPWQPPKYKGNGANSCPKAMRLMGEMMNRSVIRICNDSYNASFVSLS